MKFKKGSVSEVLSFVLIFTLFFGFIIAYLFNNIVQERRSHFVDELNKIAMNLQVELEGYSTTYDFCNMYDKNNGKITSTAEIERRKNQAIQSAKNSIQRYFNESFNTSFLELNSINDINIDILDGPRVKDVASVKITVRYYAMFKSPYAKNDGANGSTGAKMKLRLTDTASRIIENPIRQKNTKQ